MIREDDGTQGTRTTELRRRSENPNRFRYGGYVIALTIYSKPGCHLCDDMKAVVDRVVRRSALPIAVEEIDITTDADLEARYGLEIPVLVVNGRRVAKYRVTEAELTRALISRAGGAGEAG